MATDITLLSDEEILQAAGLVGDAPRVPQPEPAVSGSRPIDQFSDDEILEAAELGKEGQGSLESLGMEISQGALFSLDVLAGIPEGAGRLALAAIKFPPALGAGAGEIVTGLAAGKPLVGLQEAGKKIKEVFEFGQTPPLTQFGGTIEEVGASPFTVYREVTKIAVEKSFRASGFEGTDEDLDNITEAVAAFSFPAFLKTGKRGIGAIRSSVKETRGVTEALREEAPALESPVSRGLREEEVAPEVPVRAPERVVEPIPEEIRAEVPAAELRAPEEAPVIRKKPPVQERLEGLEAETEKIARSADEFIEEFVPPVGLGVKKVRGIEAAQEAVIPEGARIEGLFPEAEARKQAARGIKSKPVTEKVKESIRNIWNQTRHFEFLESGAETKLGKKLFGESRDGAIIEASRQFEAIHEAAKADTFSVLQGITARLNPSELKVFTENLLLEDLARDASRGMYEEKPLPFGYKGEAEVQLDLQNFKRIAEQNPEVITALEQRKSYMNELKARLVDKGQLKREVLDYDQYFHHQVLAHVQHKNTLTGGRGVRPKWRGWQKGRQGSALDYNTEYLEAEFEVISQALENLKRTEFLEKIESIADVTPELKTRAKIEGVDDFHDFLRTEEYADYVEWQPKEGSNWYKSNSITEEIMDQYVKKLREADLGDLTDTLARGARRKSLIIPERIGKQLDALGKPKTRGVPEKIARFLNTSWKQWTLLMPLRALKYFTNNLSGDFDITLAYDPKIVRPSLIKQSYKELLDFHKGRRAPSADIRQATNRGVLSSGLTIQEIPEISSSGLFKAIESRKGAEGVIGKYWNNVRDFNNFRENLLRLSAYKHFIKELKNKPDKRLYGASKRVEMDTLYDSPEFGVEDYAGKLSRELIGDYGNISQAGLWAREHLMPFYSWLEINAPRYVRLLRNLPHEGKSGARAAAIGGKRLATRAGGLTIKASVLAGAVTLWNHTMFPDAEEKLSDAQRRQLHIILGVREDGEIISMRFQGALSDALSWFGGDDLPSDVTDVVSGRASLGDKAEEALKAPLQKFANALSPIYKTPIEVATGRATFPDVFNPRPIRDPIEHVARTFSVDMPWRILSGKPSRGLKADLSSVLLYNSDPGEAAYQTVRGRVADFLEAQGDERPGFIPTKRSNALYYYKQALRYGDQEAAKKFFDEYIALGGTIQGMSKSVQRSKPLASLKANERGKFLNTLSPADRVMLKRAQAWHSKTFIQSRR